MAMWLSLGIFLPVLNFFVAILITVFYGGIISALHKKMTGQPVWLGDFFDGFKSIPRFLGLFMVGFPTFLFAILTSSVLFNALGPDAAKTLFQTGQPPSPELLQTVLPVLLEVIFKLLPLGVVIGWIVFLAIPRVVLDKRLGLLALFDAVRAMFSNLGALLLFSAGIFIVFIVACFILNILLVLIAGAGALAGILQIFLMVMISTLGWSLYLNAMYIAWRDIFMQQTSAPMSEDSQIPETQIEV